MRTITDKYLSEIIARAIASTAYEGDDDKSAAAVMAALWKADIRFCSQQERIALDTEYMLSMRARPAQTPEEIIADMDAMP